MPNIGFTIHHLAFSFPWGVAPRRVTIISPPPRASAPLSVGPTCQLPAGTRGNSGLAYPYLRQSECTLRKIYVQLLSGFVGTFGRCFWSSFTLSKCLVVPGYRV